MDMEKQVAEFKFNFSRIKGRQLFLFWPYFLISNEGIIGYCGIMQQLLLEKKYSQTKPDIPTLCSRAFLRPPS